MIKLTDLLKESSPGFNKRKFGDALPTLASVKEAHQAKLKLAEADSFTAINKSTGNVTAFKSKEARDSAVKAGSHDESEDDAETGGDTPAEKEKPNMFSKDAGYDDGSDDDDDDEDEDEDEDEDVIDLPQEVQDEFEDSVKDLGYSWADIGTIPGVISFMDKDENAVMVSTGAAYGGDEPFYVSGYNLPDMEDGESDETNGKSFDTKEDAMAYAKELAQTLKGGEAKEEPLNVTDDFIDSLKSQYKNVSKQTPEQEKELETTLDKLDKKQLKKLAFSDINVVSDIASKKWYKLSYPSDDEPKKDKSEPSTSDSIDNAYDAKDFKSTVKSLKGKVSDEDYNEIKDNLKALANLQYDLGDIDRDEDNEEWGMQKDTIDVEVDDLKGLITKAIDNQVDKNGVPLKAIDKDLDNSFEKPEEEEPTKLKYSKDGKMTQDSADSIEKELNAELGVNGTTDINLDTGTIEYFISDDSEEAIFIGKEEGGKGVAVSFGDGGDEYKTFKNSKDAVAYAKELGNQLKGGEAKEEPKSEPTKDSTQQRAGNTEVNKSVRNQAKKLGITPAKLGKEEYQKAMVGAAYEALTDSNFSTEARQLLAVITGDEKLAEKPDYPSMSDEDFDTKIAKIRKDREAGDIYTTPENDKASELGQHSSSESSWSGADAIDAIAFDLKMNGYKDLASKIQSVIKED